jgi:hypothetical protein
VGQWLKSGFFSRGRLGAGLGSAVFLETGLAADFVFVPAVFAVLAFAADVTTLGFLGITVNSSSFPQWGHFAMVFLLC